MIKYYVPNALMKTAGDIAKDHSHEGEHYILADHELAALLDRINETKEENLRLFAAALTPREKASLAEYYPGNRFKKQLSKLSKIFQYSMTSSLYEILVKGWQNFPRNRSLFWLIAGFASQDKYYKILEITPQVLGRWKARYEDASDYYNAIVMTLNTEKETLYDSFRRRGLRTDSVLYMECLASYMSSCSWDALMKEGVQEVMRVITMTQPSERAEQIMLNVLNKAKVTGNTYTILAFGSEANGSIGSPFPVFYRQFQEPRRSRFPHDAEQAFENYQYWCNYERLISSFNKEQDPRRINFWKRYLTRCKLTQYKKSQFLVMDFGKYVAVESETIGTLYFYGKEYFQDEVLKVLVKENKTVAKSWMKNGSIPIYDKRHSGLWETDVLYRMRSLGMI